MNNTPIQTFREKLDKDQLCVGAGITFSDPAVSEALCDSVDFLWIDMEHSPISLVCMQSHLIAARAGRVPALVRIPRSDTAWIKRVLDTGGEGIIVPQVRSAAEVQQCVSACRYPPQGTRGFGPRRSSNYGRSAGPEYVEHANRGVFFVAQIETVEAVEELDEILAIPGLDSLVIGPYDLSGSMGMLGQVTHPKVLKTIEQIVTKTRQAGVYIGIGLGADEAHAIQAAEMGIQWIQCGGDFGYMVSFVDELFPTIRKRAAEAG